MKMVFTRLPKIFVALLILITSQCGCGKGSEHKDHRPDITPELLEAARPWYQLYRKLLDLKEGKPVNFNKKDTADSTTSLQFAIDIGNEDLVKFLLKEGADVNLEGGYLSHTPLLYAIDKSTYSLPIIKLLLKQPNIDKEKKDKFNNYTPLFTAISRAYPDVVQALLDAGADYTTSIDGKTPYRFALERANSRVFPKQDEKDRIVKILRDKGAPLY